MAPTPTLPANNTRVCVRMLVCIDLSLDTISFYRLYYFCLDRNLTTACDTIWHFNISMVSSEKFKRPAL